MIYLFHYQTLNIKILYWLLLGYTYINNEETTIELLSVFTMIWSTSDLLIEKL
jgi:hypothetical protein